ncbi:MAG TPA: zinc-binding dehydrogenase [Acidimicrobiia bacterium]|nr:zinc-binding dehydrogenase [Acidimicrobiia bacterium]
MKALVCAGDGSANVVMSDLEEPTPSPDQLVVDVKAASVNRGELRLLQVRDRGWRPGQDIAGIVVDAAVDGTGPPVGTRVVAWVDQAGWAERAVADTDRVAILGDGTSFAEAATLPVAGMTALRALRRGGSLLGKRVLITGAAGGVGRFAVELAARSGAKVTAVAGGSDRRHGLAELGATEVVERIGDADGGFDLILESVGGETLEQAFRAVNHSGTVVVFGISSGEPASFSFRDFSQRPIRVEVFFVYESGRPFGPDLQVLADQVGQGSLHPYVGLEVGWDQAAEAFRELAERRVNGKAVLRIG